jgi:hypothetical protein
MIKFQYGNIIGVNTCNQFTVEKGGKIKVINKLSMQRGS